MYIFKKQADLTSHLSKFRTKNLSIGFVPTMGALHLGHISLVSISKKANTITVVSIFVNPTQFNSKEDYDNYPSTIDNDTALLKEAGCDILFLPSSDDIYKNQVVAQHFDFDGLEFEMEGKHRTGHFNGVGTIVKTLFEIIRPDNAYFGEKDFQQLQIVKKLVDKNNLAVRIHGCPVYREKDGLAMSSRNTRLTRQQRLAAPFIFASLQKAAALFTHKSIDQVVLQVENEFKKNALLELEYFTIADETTLRTVSKKEPGKSYRAFIAVYAGNIRLIDNIKLEI